MPQICIYLLGLCEKKWDKNYSQIMSPCPPCVWKWGGGHVPPGPMVAPPMGLGANLWHGTSPYQIHTPSPTYKTLHAVQEPQPIKRLPISPPSIVILRVLTSSSQSNSVISDLQWIQASLPVRDGGLGVSLRSHFPPLWLLRQAHCPSTTTSWLSMPIPTATFYSPVWRIGLRGFRSTGPKPKSMPTLAVSTSSLQSRLKPWDLWTRQHANSLVIWEGRSPHPQAMTGKELFCSKKFRYSASTLSCYMTACQPLTVWSDRSVPNFVYLNF